MRKPRNNLAKLLFLLINKKVISKYCIITGECSDRCPAFRRVGKTKKVRRACAIVSSDKKLKSILRQQIHTKYFLTPLTIYQIKKNPNTQKKIKWSIWLETFLTGSWFDEYIKRIGENKYEEKR